MAGTRVLSQAIAGLGLACCINAGAYAQAYPNKPIKLILPNTTGSPMAIVDRLHVAVSEALAAPELKASFAKFGFDIINKPLGELEPFMAAEARKWPPIVKAAGLKPE